MIFVETSFPKNVSPSSNASNMIKNLVITSQAHGQNHTSNHPHTGNKTGADRFTKELQEIQSIFFLESLSLSCRLCVWLHEQFSLLAGDVTFASSMQAKSRLCSCNFRRHLHISQLSVNCRPTVG